MPFLLDLKMQIYTLHLLEGSPIEYLCWHFHYYIWYTDSLHYTKCTYSVLCFQKKHKNRTDRLWWTLAWPIRNSYFWPVLLDVSEFTYAASLVHNASGSRVASHIHLSRWCWKISDIWEVLTRSFKRFHVMSSSSVSPLKSESNKRSLQTL